MRCSICKRELPEDAFYASDKYRCKECHREQKKKSYDKYHPKVYMSSDGQLMMRSRGHPCIFWSGNMISTLKRYYPNTSNEELVGLLGVSERTIVRKARELGLFKSKEYISHTAKAKSFMAHVVLNKKNKQVNI